MNQFQFEYLTVEDILSVGKSISKLNIEEKVSN